MQKPDLGFPGARFLRMVRQLRRTAGERSFWILVVMLGGLAALHYLRPQIVLGSFGFVERHAVERIMFLLPIALAAFVYGQAGGLITLVLSFLIMLPRVILLSDYPGDAFLETLAVGVVGYLLVWIIVTQEREKQLRQEAVMKLRTINAVRSSITGSLELDVILRDALDKVLEATQTQTGCIFLVDQMTRELTLAACRGLPFESSGEGQRYSAAEGLCGWVARTGKPRVVADLAAEPELACKPFEPVGARSLIAVPLTSRKRVMGVMELADLQPGRFNGEDLDLLTTVGSAIGVAIENAWLCNNIRYYAQQVTRAQEHERARIARELHDDTIQSLVVLARRIEALVRLNEEKPPVETRQLRELQEITDNIIQGIRRFSRDLRPSTLDDLGLLPTLEGLAASMTEKDGILTELHVLGERRRLAPETELVLFRIAQEALNNIKKHADATRAAISIRFGDDMVELVVRDNGKGFALHASIEELAVTGHLGLIGMRERARLLGGHLTIQTQPGKGTKVTVTVPIRR
ncbi:MAG: GAF domain-containing sensor histidine kinase [Anaerolineae bacterium]|nr:GAF domain-containing sensor histidine kinase [Anaerolineae bacterium]